MYYKSNYNELNLKDGDEVWAYAFRENLHNNPATKPNLNQTPVLGVIHEKYYGSATFIPYKKNKHELAKSREVDAQSRRYATSEKDAWSAYCKDIQNVLNQHETRMNFLRNYFNNVPGIPKTLRVMQNGICRLVCNISPVRPENKTTELSIESLPNIPLYTSCILPNLLVNAELRVESKDSSEHVTSINSQTVQQTDIFIEGYDKDNGLYEPLFEASSVEDAYVIAASWLELQRKTDMFRSSANDPYDWFIVNDHDYRNIVC